MPGEDSTVAEGVPSPLDEAGPDSPSIEISDFEREWRDLVGALRTKRRYTDVDKRHSPEPVKTAFDLALSNPESVSISAKPVSRRRDMTEHIHSDIEMIMNSDWAERNLINPRPKLDTLLKLFEMGYLYDAVFRFLNETVIRTDRDGLEDISFVEIPAAIHEWMGEVNVTWGIASGDIRPEEEPFGDRVTRLWREREEFVEEAKSMDIFLPVPADSYGNPDDIRESIETRLKRNSEVSPERIHRYCYSRVTDY